MHWKTEESWFDSRWGQENASLFQIVQTLRSVQPLYQGEQGARAVEVKGIGVELTASTKGPG
jgi:hypothetical protein